MSVHGKFRTGLKNIGLGLLTLLPQPSQSAPLPFPSAKVAPYSVTTMPSAQELIDSGQITLEYNHVKSQKFPHKKRYEQWVNGTTQAIQDVLDHDQYGRVFLERIQQDGLVVNMESTTNHHRAGENSVYVNLASTRSEHYLDFTTGDAIIFSNHRKLEHELFHYVAKAVLPPHASRFEHEIFAIENTDIIMEQKYNEKPRRTYANVTYKFPEGSKKVDFYKPGETYADKAGHRYHPKMRRYDHTLFVDQLYAMQQTQKPEDAIKFARHVASVIQAHLPNKHLDFMNYQEIMQQFEIFCENQKIVMTAVRDIKLTEEELEKLKAHENISVRPPRPNKPYDSYKLSINSTPFQKKIWMQERDADRAARTARER